MRKSLVVVCTAGALLSASLVWAAPRALSSTELETVKAGTSVTDAVLGDQDDVVLGVADNGAFNVSGDDNFIPSADAHTLAVAGDGNTVAADNSNAIFTDDNQANTGLTNKNVYGLENGAMALGDGSIAIDDANDYTALAVGTHNAALGLESYVDDGSVAMAGFGNVVTTGDENDFDNDEDAFSVYGANNVTTGVIYNYTANIVYADEVCASDSFNTEDIFITVDICDSFNQTAKTLDISGQEEVTAIALANTLGEQLVGVNLNVSSSTGVVPGYGNAVDGVGVSSPVGSCIGTATAATNLVQTVINNSLLISEFECQAPEVTMSLNL